jgi:hypothetical protein
MSDIILDGMEFNTNSTSNNNNNNNYILKHLGGSFDNNHGIENDNSDDENDIINNQRNENNDNIIKKVNTPQRMFLTRRLSGMPVLPPSNSFDMFDKTTVSQNKIDDDVLAKLNELIDSLPNPPTINHLQNTQNTSSITSTAVKAVSLGWGSFKGFASNLIGGKK